MKVRVPPVEHRTSPAELGLSSMEPEGRSIMLRSGIDPKPGITDAGRNIGRNSDQKKLANQASSKEVAASPPWGRHSCLPVNGTILSRGKAARHLKITTQPSPSAQQFTSRSNRCPAK